MNMRNQNSNDDMKEIKQFIKHRASEIDPAWASNVDGQKNAKGNPRTYYESTSTTIVVRHVSSKYGFHASLKISNREIGAEQ